MHMSMSWQHLPASKSTTARTSFALRWSPGKETWHPRAVNSDWKWPSHLACRFWPALSALARVCSTHLWYSGSRGLWGASLRSRVFGPGREWTVCLASWLIWWECGWGRSNCSARWRLLCCLTSKCLPLFGLWTSQWAWPCWRLPELFCWCRLERLFLVLEIGPFFV